jgi:chorismate-pyruvate lyase
MRIEEITNKILSAPVGYVVDTLQEVLNYKITVKIIEQNKVAPKNFVRKVIISANRFPVIEAQVNFDPSIIPKFILDELLKRKKGIGNILTQNNINATRNVISVVYTSNNIITRKYEIIYQGETWFFILEKINLNGLVPNYNGRGTQS